jgi:uncharacterized phage-associated protein
MQNCTSPLRNGKEIAYYGENKSGIWRLPKDFGLLSERLGVMAYNPIKVANEFLRLAQVRQPAVQLTPLKLLKLVYIAHGWSLHFLHEPLVNEQAEAWQYGPVVPSLYRAVRSYKASPVNYPIVGDNDPRDLSEDAASLIEAVLDTYGSFSGVQLSNMTHMPNTPWSNTWHNLGRNSVIPNDEIAQHYAVLAARQNQN